MNYSTYCKTRLAHARTQLGTLDENEADLSVLLANINGVRNIIFEILDYLVNHYKGNIEEFRRLGFPIKAITYINDGKYIVPKAYDECIEDIKKMVGSDAVDFINQAYLIIDNPIYDQCILLLDAASKHRNKDEIIIDKPQTKFDYSEVDKGNSSGFVINWPHPSSDDFPLKVDMYGKPKLSFLQGMDNIVLLGTTVNYTDRSFLIKSLVTTKQLGKSLLITKDGSKVNVLITPFLENCIECCDAVIDLWNKI